LCFLYWFFATKKYFFANIILYLIPSEIPMWHVRLQALNTPTKWECPICPRLKSKNGIVKFFSKENPTKGKNTDNQPVYSKAIPEEADAAQSESYKKIHASKMLKGVPAASGGTSTGQVLNSECGSFFNPGDNRISRTVYQEDHLSLSVTSLSFNPTNWECSQCPKKHRIFEQGGGGKCSVPVIVLSDQNFPGYCLLFPGNVSQLSGWNREKLMS
jgi:hypothetical protein